MTNKENRKLLKTLPVSSKLYPYLIMTCKNVLLQKSIDQYLHTLFQNTEKMGTVSIAPGSCCQKESQVVLKFGIFEGFILILIFEIVHISLNIYFL